jgi:hypothetical protein
MATWNAKFSTKMMRTATDLETELISVSELFGLTLGMTKTCPVLP